MTPNQINNLRSKVSNSGGLIKPEELKKVVVDSTVMPKAIAHPTDSKLLETSRDKLVEVAKVNGIALKQTFEREGKYLTHKAGRYGHAKQFRRMRKVIKRNPAELNRKPRLARALPVARTFMLY